MIPTYKEDGLGGLDRMPGWFLGDERLFGPIQGLFYAHSKQAFCNEEGEFLPAGAPYTFQAPKELFTPSDQPHVWVNLSPYDFPTPETVSALLGIVNRSFPGLTIAYQEVDNGRDYFTISNQDGNAETFSVGQIARAIMVWGVPAMERTVGADLKLAKVI